MNLWHQQCAISPPCPCTVKCTQSKNKNSNQAKTPLTSRPRPPACAVRLTSEKSGIVTSSRSRGRPLLLAALLKKLATEPQLSYNGHQGAKQNNNEDKDFWEGPHLHNIHEEVENSKSIHKSSSVLKKNQKSVVFIPNSNFVTSGSSFILHGGYFWHKLLFWKTELAKCMKYNYLTTTSPNTGMNASYPHNFM